MIAQEAAEAARGCQNHPVFEEHDGLESTEYFDILYDDTFGTALDPAGVRAARQTEL